MPPRKPKLSPSAVPVEAITHADKRANLPTADAYEFVAPEVEKPQQVRYPRDPSLDPQLVWKGKDAQDSEDLVAEAPPIYIQEKIHPQALIEDLRAGPTSNRYGSLRASMAWMRWRSLTSTAIRPTGPTA